MVLTKENHISLIYKSAWNISIEPVVIIYLDFPKASDKVLHKRLLK